MVAMTYLECELEQEFVDVVGQVAAVATRASKTTDRPRVLVADPDRLARRALTDSLREDGDFAVIGQASDGVEAVELARHYRPDIVLVATSLTGIDAVTACERIAAGTPETRVVVLATAPDLDLETSCVRAGASGFVIKSAEADAIKRALTIVCAGHAIISPELTAMLVERLRRTPADGTGTRPVKSALTNREWEILDLMCGQMGTREIADTLFLSPETVNSHVKNVLKKLGVHSRAAAVEAASMIRADVLV
jgi:two-component system, NarL family, response regulator LiaR